MPKLSDGFELKSLRLRNRIVMAPMVTGLAVGGAVSDALVAWYAERARGGAGLVLVESTAVLEDAAIIPRNLGIWEDAQVEGLARLAAAIRAEGVPAVIQLVHGGARAWRAGPDAARPGPGAPRVGPSSTAHLPGPPPRPLAAEELPGIIEAFAAAAARAEAAGFDGAEVHAAHYYLLSEFLSPYSNRRTDSWGGDRSGRARLAVEAIRAVRERVGPGFAVFCRMHAVEEVAGGVGAEDARYYAEAFVGAGADLIDASAVARSAFVPAGEGTAGAGYLETSSLLPKEAPPGLYAPMAGALRSAAAVPVMAVGKLGEPGAAAAVLRAGQADLVALGRQLIADPGAAAKLLAGRDGEIRRCTECNACFAAIRKGPIACSVNPEAGLRA